MATFLVSIRAISGQQMRWEIHCTWYETKDRPAKPRKWMAPETAHSMVGNAIVYDLTRTHGKKIWGKKIGLNDLGF